MGEGRGVGTERATFLQPNCGRCNWLTQCPPPPPPPISLLRTPTCSLCPFVCLLPPTPSFAITFFLHIIHLFSSLPHRIVGLVVKASSSRAEDTACAGIFPESRLKNWHSTLPGAWRYRVSAGTGWPSVSILWLGEMESWICNFYFSEAARKLFVWTDPSLILHSHVAGTLSNQQTSLPHCFPFSVNRWGTSPDRILWRVTQSSLHRARPFPLFVGHTSLTHDQVNDLVI